MSTRKGQNSILFLTTLGVYLGLVLVGSPHVLAQAATSRQFDVREEIEQKDDLDKKPNSDAFLESFRAYIGDLDAYFREVREADTARGSKYQYPNEEAIPVVSGACHEIGDASRLFKVESTGATPLPILLDPNYGPENWSWITNCRPNPNLDRLNLEFGQIEVSRTHRGDFEYKISISLSTESDAKSVFDGLSRAAKYLQLTDFSERQKVLWNNTQFTVAQSTVSVVTHLPRASLDDLLAKDAK